MDRNEAAWQRRGEIPESAAGYHPGSDSRRDWGLRKRKGRYGSLGTEKHLRQCASGAHPASIPQSNANCLCTKTEITLANGTFLRYDPYRGEDGCLYRNSGKAAGALRGQRCAERWEKILLGIRGLGTDPGRKDQELPSRFGSFVRAGIRSLRHRT